MTAREALDALLLHPCAHPPRCMHSKYSECRNALVEAIVAAAENAKEPQPDPAPTPRRRKRP